VDIFAVGDIHGRFDLFQMALAEIRSRKAGATIVFLGDYIDRGSDSRQVIAALMAGPPEGETWVCLKGNHEEMMCKVHRGDGPWDWWCRNGGTQTLQSFGYPIPPAVLEWCDSLPVAHETRHHFFVHAGINPDVPITAQSADDMLWIRRKFLEHEGPLPVHVVHGHTINDEPELLEHRTNLDTGAFYTGVLTVGRFDTSKRGGPVDVFSLRSSIKEP
jgi:serine/threonine protein phosphatase 1